ncbi:hypothetical protein D3C84_1205940 [compost metagenome]
MERAFRQALIRARDQGELGPNADVRMLAQYLYHARYALTQSAKLTKDPQQLEELAAVALSVLDRS